MQMARSRKRRLIHLDTHVVWFAAVAARAQAFAWTRDPFDRLIAAQAAVARARLVTRDDLIRRHFRAALW